MLLAELQEAAAPAPDLAANPLVNQAVPTVHPAFPAPPTFVHSTFTPPSSSFPVPAAGPHIGGGHGPLVATPPPPAVTTPLPGVPLAFAALAVAASASSIPGALALAGLR